MDRFELRSCCSDHGMDEEEDGSYVRHADAFPDISGLTKNEKSCLAYIECCCVDQGGLLEGARMNETDLDAISKFLHEGIVKRFGRIPARLLRPTMTRQGTHYVELTEKGWAVAAAVRQWRARPEARGPYATSVFTTLDAKEN